MGLHNGKQRHTNPTSRNLQHALEHREARRASTYSSHTEVNASHDLSEALQDPHVQALYEEQQKINAGGFKNKHDQIRKQYNEFWSHRSARADVAAYLDQRANHTYDTRPRWVQPRTVFTSAPNRKLAENEVCSIIGVRASFDVAQYQESPHTAAMSMMHLLALPKACFYNGVSLTPENVWILDSMIKLFRTSWLNKTFREAVLEHQRLAIQQQYQSKSSPDTADVQGYRLALQHHEELKGYVSHLSADDSQFGLHLYPDHSVSHLHMHLVAMPRHMRKYSTTEHDLKTKDASEVRDFILSLRQLIV